MSEYSSYFSEPEHPGLLTGRFKREIGQKWASREWEDRVTIPDWLKETLAQDVKKTEESNQIGKESYPTGPTHVKEDRMNSPISPKETLARDFEQTKETHEIGKKSRYTGPARIEETRPSLPIWLKESLAQDVKQTKETNEIGKKPGSTGPSHVEGVQGTEVLSPSLSSHMQGLAQANRETLISPDISNGRVRGLSEVSTLSGSVLEMATHSAAVTDSPQRANYSRRSEHIVSPNHVKAFYTSKDKSYMPLSSVQDGKPANKRDSSTLPGSLPTPTQVAPPIKPAKRPPMQSTQDQTIKEGRLFAQLAGNKYGSAKYMASRVQPKASTALQPSVINEDKAAMDWTASIPNETPGMTAPVGNDRNKDSGMPSKSSEKNASISTPSNPMSPANMLSSVVHSGIASSIDRSQEENREHTTFFKSWGPQLTRDTPAAQKRKVFLTGDPTWESAPKPDFIASLVYGGQLEQIHCNGASAAVTFINAADAENYYNKTPNGVLYRTSNENLQYFAEVRMADDVTPVSGMVQEYVNNGSTRCVRAIGVDVAKSLEELHAVAVGKSSVPRKLEGLEDNKSPQGHRVVTFRFCNIRQAVHFRNELVRTIEWENANVQFTTDPCEEATGPRIEIRPTMSIF